MIEIAARNHPLLAFRAIDLDKEPGLARDIGVHSYNTAVLQAGDRKVLVENVTDAARLGYAALRVLRQRARDDLLRDRPWRDIPPHARPLPFQSRRDAEGP